MSEIQYYGGSGDSNATPFFGATVKAWGRINASRTALNSEGISVPYIYIMSMDEAAEVNSKSFTFPLRVWVSEDENRIYTSPHFAKSAKEFRSILSECNENSTIIVSRSPIEHDGSVIYLAKDGWIMGSSNEKLNLPMSADFSKLWEKFDFPDNFVLRLRWPTSGSWVVDGIIDRDNEYIAKYFGRSARNATKKSFNAFRLGFVNGYNFELNEYTEYLGNNFMPGIADDFRISDDTKLARFQGFCLGQEARYKAGKHMNAFASTGSEKEKVKALAALNPDTVTKLQHLGSLHNAIMDQDREETAKKLAAFYSGSPADSWMQMRSAYDYLNIYLNTLNKSDVKTSKWNDYSDKLDFNMDVEFELTDSVKFKEAQFRILKTSSDSLQIRFQSDNLSGKRIATTSTGKTYEISVWKKQKVELSFKVDNFSLEKLDALQALTYSQESQAGTGVMYAPCVIKDNMIVAVEGNVEVTSLDNLKTQVAAYFNMHKNH